MLSLRGGDATVVAGGAEDTETTCPTVLPGVNYMFPRKREHTILHIFNKAAPVWEEKYQGQAMAFKMFKVTTKFTVKVSTTIYHMVSGYVFVCEREI